MTRMDTFVSGYMMVYLLSVRMLATACASLFSSRHSAVASSGLVVLCAALSSGFVVHVQTMNWWTVWMRWISPLYWTLHSMQRLELSNVTAVECSRNPLTRQEAPGLVLKIPCGVSNGAQALNYWAHSFDRVDSYLPILLVMAFWLVFQLLHSVISVCIQPPVRKASRHRAPHL